MTTLVVAFTTYLCPGAVKLLGFTLQLAVLPASAKPALAVAGICEARPAFEVYDPARAAAARARVIELGRPTQLYEVRGVVKSEPLVDWKTEATFKGE